MMLWCVVVSNKMGVARVLWSLVLRATSTMVGGVTM